MHINLTTPMSDDKEWQRKKAAMIDAIEQYTEKRMNEENTDGSRSGGQPLLLPCPFCGGLQIEAFHHIDRGWGASWHVECVAEECGNSTCHHDTVAAAIAAWNNRQPTQSDAPLDAEGVKLYWYRQGKDDGVEHERAKIVAWLRGMGLRNINYIADAIEVGEHLK